jgi:hypothetical protein
MAEVLRLAMRSSGYVADGVAPALRVGCSRIIRIIRFPTVRPARTTCVADPTNLGENHAVFEAVHGSAPDIAGRGIANPTGLMQSAVLLLKHLGERTAAARLQAAIYRSYAEGRYLTPDVGGSASTSEFADAVVRNLEF